MQLIHLGIAPEVAALRPDFVVLAILARGVENGPTTAESDGWLAAAEGAARARHGAAPDPHVQAWRDAYRGFGAKPQRTASSVDALCGRAAAGQLPRVNWLVDLYNAISVTHTLPVGGEDAERFVGPLQLVRARGDEAFDTVKDGLPIVEHPLSGEVVWADDAGVTCRRWNWRQGTRTRLTEESTEVLFLLERLEPYPLDGLEAAADSLIQALRSRTPRVAVERRRLGPGLPPDGVR